jgi:hypothetical protein
VGHVENKKEKAVYIYMFLEALHMSSIDIHIFLNLHLFSIVVGRENKKHI